MVLFYFTGQLSGQSTEKLFGGKLKIDNKT